MIIISFFNFCTYQAINVLKFLNVEIQFHSGFWIQYLTNERKQRENIK